MLNLINMHLQTTALLGLALIYSLGALDAVPRIRFLTSRASLM